MKDIAGLQKKVVKNTHFNGKKSVYTWWRFANTAGFSEGENTWKKNIYKKHSL